MLEEWSVVELGRLLINTICIYIIIYIRRNEMGRKRDRDSDESNNNDAANKEAYIYFPKFDQNITKKIIKFLPVIK